MTALATAIARRLAAWYRENARDLPWRRTRDPYAVWVSETMLQQTTVAAVTPRFDAFLVRFPNVRALAEAETADVLGAVAGLGYYRRFRFLKAAAEKLLHERDGRLPETLAEWRDLPGVGAYMAGAILSIAFDRPEPAVDGNVCRVMARLFERTGDLLRPGPRRETESFIREMMAVEPPGVITQALFDLGAGICIPAEPRCLICPVRESCGSLRAGTTDRFPEKKVRAAMREVHVASAAIEADGRLLIVRRAADLSLMPDFFETPAVWEESAAAAERALILLVARICGGTPKLGAVLARARHTITTHKLQCTLYSVTADPPHRTAEGEHAWIAPDSPERAPGALTSITTKLLRALRVRAD